MGRIYSAQFSAVAVTAAQDFFEIAAPATASVVVHGWCIGQTSDTGDAAEELLRLETVRGEGTVTSGSGGTTPTARPIVRGDSAAGSTVEANNTTRMATGTGTLITLPQYTWNVRQEYMMLYPPELRPVIRPSDRWTLSLPSAPADSLTVNGTVWFEEIG